MSQERPLDIDLILNKKPESRFLTFVRSMLPKDPIDRFTENKIDHNSPLSDESLKEIENLSEEL